MSTDTVVLNGVEHWLTSNGVRTFVGPVRHRASRRISKARAAIAAKLNRSKEKPVQPIGDNDATITIPAVREGDPNETTANITPVSAQVTRMLEGLKLPTFHVNGDEPQGYKGQRRARGWWHRAAEATLDSLYDNTFHEMIQNTCKTVSWIALTITASVVFGKALLWVVTL